MRSKSIKVPVKGMRDRLDDLFEDVWNVIHNLDLDPVSGNSPHLNSVLDRDLQSLRQNIEEAQTIANRILDYPQPDASIAFTPKKGR